MLVGGIYEQPPRQILNSQSCHFPKLSVRATSSSQIIQFFSLQNLPCDLCDSIIGQQIGNNKHRNDWLLSQKSFVSRTCFDTPHSSSYQNNCVYLTGQTNTQKYQEKLFQQFWQTKCVELVEGLKAGVPGVVSAIICWIIRSNVPPMSTHYFRPPPSVYNGNRSVIILGRLNFSTDF